MNKETEVKPSVLIISLVITFLLSISFVSPLDSLGIYKQGETVRVVQVCSDATYINISSIAYPNSSVAISNVGMTSAGSESSIMILLLLFLVVMMSEVFQMVVKELLLHILLLLQLEKIIMNLSLE